MASETMKGTVKVICRCGCMAVIENPPIDLIKPVIDAVPGKDEAPCPDHGPSVILAVVIEGAGGVAIKATQATMSEIAGRADAGPRVNVPAASA